MPFQHLVISVPVQNITKILRFCRFFYFVQPVTVCICLHLNFQKKGWNTLLMPFYEAFVC